MSGKTGQVTKVKSKQSRRPACGATTGTGSHGCGARQRHARHVPLAVLDLDILVVVPDGSVPRLVTPGGYGELARDRVDRAVAEQHTSEAALAASRVARPGSHRRASD